MAKKTAAPPVARTHRVAQNILHNGTFYIAGSHITFEDEFPEEKIRKLIELGVLEGDAADQIRMQRLMREEQTGIAPPGKMEIERLWAETKRLSLEQRLAKELAEARAKEDAEAARLANQAEARTRHRPDEDLVDEDEEGE